MVAAVFLLGPTQAWADGDPASDYLIEQALFLSPEAGVPARDQRELTAVLEQAMRRGFPIRVAVIQSTADLGSVTALWRKPREYAPFLAAEISYFYRGRLLVIMPNGFGLDYPNHDTVGESALLARIPIEDTPAGLAQAATRAVQILASAQGVRVGEAAPRLTTREVLEIVGAALVLLPLAGLLLVPLLRRRREGESPAA